MGNFTNIHFEVEEGIATLTLNRPQALNALTFALMGEVLTALGEVNSNPDIAALVITGAGRGFCSGQDLRSRPEPGADVVSALMDDYFPALNAIRECSVPVVTAVNGVAAGAGCAFALLGNATVAAESARFIQVFSRIGLAPDLGSTFLLPRLIGRTRALRMMLSNEPVPARTALQWGLIDECVEDGELAARAREMAQELASGPEV